MSTNRWRMTVNYRLKPEESTGAWTIRVEEWDHQHSQYVIRAVFESTCLKSALVCALEDELGLVLYDAEIP